MVTNFVSKVAPIVYGYIWAILKYITFYGKTICVLTIPSLVCVYFCPFKQTLQFFTTNMCEEVSIQYTVLGLEPMISMT